MLSQPRLFRLLALVLALSLLLVACERPIPGGDETEEQATVETGVETGAVTAEVSESEGEVTGVEVTATEEPTEAIAATSEVSTPRIDEEVENVESSEAVEEGKPAEKEETGETTEVMEEATVEETATEEAVETTAVEEETAAEVSEATVPTTHTVAAGENLYRIGLLYNVSWVALAEFNNLGNANKITVGQVLQIPGETQPQAEATPSPLTETTYTVKVGDNLYRIGLAYGISWVQIAEANGLVNPNQILVGQVLKIPVDTPGPTPQFTHQVKAGETLFLISLQYGVPWPAIADANNIGSPYVIYTGQTLVIPGG